jgi:histidine triad (HIT) family protein
MRDCLFCKIVAGQIPSTKVFEDENVLAFMDIDPKAPVHILIIPKAHYDSLLSPGADTAVAALFATAASVAREVGVDESGFRVVINTGKDGGQAVGHLHLHLLGGRALAWPPG